MEVKNHTRQVPSSPIDQTKNDEGYSTTTKVAIVGGVVVAVGLFWWCGGVAATTTLLGKVFTSSSTLTAAQMTSAKIAAGKAVAGAAGAGCVVEKGIEKGVELLAGPEKEMQDLSRKCDEALQKVDQNALKGKRDRLDKLVSGLSSEGIRGIRNANPGSFQIPAGDDHITVQISDTTNGFAALAEMKRKLFSPENLQHAEIAVNEAAEAGKSLDIPYYKPLIDFLYEQDSVKYKPLKDKLRDLEKAQSVGENVKDSVVSSTKVAGAAIVGAAAEKLITYGQSRINQEVEKKLPNPENQKTEQQELDKQVLDAIMKEDGCDGIIELEKFKKLADDAFIRNPNLFVLYQGQYEKCLKDIKERIDKTA